MEKMEPKTLPYTTKSICPECSEVVEATVSLFSDQGIHFYGSFIDKLK